MPEAVIISRTLNVASFAAVLRALRDEGYRVGFALTTAENPACGLNQLKNEGRACDIAIITTLPDKITVEAIAQGVWARWPDAIVIEAPPSGKRSYQGFCRQGELVRPLCQETLAALIRAIRAINHGDTPPAAP